MNVSDINEAYQILFIFLCVVFLAPGCEDVIDVNLSPGTEVLVVDAWLNDLERVQVIRLSLSQPYFDNTVPAPVTDAKVVVTRNDSTDFEFEHNIFGRYIWRPDTALIGQAGDKLSLKIKYDNTLYTAHTTMSRVPKIDTLNIAFKDDILLSDDGLYADFYARDFSGKNDTYWIKTYVNGAYLNKAQELNIAYDAGLDRGSGIDGLVFIPPIREGINQLGADLIPIPYNYGDEIRVEIHSIRNEAFEFLESAREQISNGDNSIFSIPLANPISNIIANNEANVLGFFSVAAVSSVSKKIPD